MATELPFFSVLDITRQVIGPLTYHDEEDDLTTRLTEQCIYLELVVIHFVLTIYNLNKTAV